MKWLVNEETLAELRQAQASDVRPSAEEQKAFLERVEAREGGPRNLTLAGDVAEVRVEGLLVRRRSFMLMLFGFAQTTYQDIQEAIAIARSDASVRSVRFYIDSPGGELDGLFDTFAAIEELRADPTMSVSVEAVKATSAAYGIAAVAGPITARHQGAVFGSIGVVATLAVDENVVEITNRASPDKRPDPTTKKGRAVVEDYLDAVFGLFAEAIATGRGTTIEDVTKNYGRGALLVARDAAKRKMIDTVAGPRLRAVPSTEAASAATMKTPEEGNGMDIKTLMADHPDVYEAAVKEGVEKERKRVSAHLKLGKTTGAMDIAEKAIASGASTLDEEVHAEYLSAGMNKRDREERQVETDRAGAAADGAQPETDKGDLGDQVVAVVKAQGGL